MPKDLPRRTVCRKPNSVNRRYENAGGRYIGCATCKGDLCVNCRVTHLEPSNLPVEENEDNRCKECQPSEGK